LFALKIRDDEGNVGWTFDGHHHRTDGPAVERFDGVKFWFVKGKLHRLDGPAAEYVNGDKEWFIYGKKYSEQKFYEKVDLIKRNQILHHICLLFQESSIGISQAFHQKS